jgi:hypothetical protein
VIVVKVGGSLFDHPHLGAGLHAYLEALAPRAVLLVPGGGDLTEAVRKLDRLHGLGQEAAHRLALQTMTVTAAFLAQVGHCADLTGRVRILDAHTFAEEDEGKPGALPHTWAVTADSIAARVAVLHQAERLILLKSIAMPLGSTWAEAAERGWVDRHFPNVVAGVDFPIEVVNFWHYLDEMHTVRADGSRKTERPTLQG